MILEAVGVEEKLAQSLDILPSKNSRKEDAMLERDAPLGGQETDVRDRRLFSVDQS